MSASPRLAGGGRGHKNCDRSFRFEEIQDAHRLMESSQASGEIMVTMP